MTLRYGMEIRAATAAEAPGLATLLAEAGLPVEAGTLAEQVAAMRQGPSAILLALQWGPPSGVVAMHWYPSLLSPRPIAQVTMLLVSAEERRRGIGRMLLKAAAQAARAAGCGDLELIAAPEVPSLAAFCRATGFTEAGPRFVRSLRKQR